MKRKKYTFNEFKKFLVENCWDEKKYGDGKYDRKIYNWFDVNKPNTVEFYKKGEFTKLMKGYKKSYEKSKYDREN